MHRHNWYYRFLADTEWLENHVLDIEQSDADIIKTTTVDGGVIEGFQVQENSLGPDFSVDIDAGLAYNEAGQRVYNPTLFNFPFVDDANNDPIEVVGIGNERYVALYAYRILVDDPTSNTLDGNLNVVYTRTNERTEVRAYQGTEALIGTATPPANPLNNGVLIGTVLITYGDLTIVDADINGAQDLLTVVPPVTSFSRNEFLSSNQYINWNGTGVVANSAIIIEFLDDNGQKISNILPASTYNIADNEVLIVRPNRTTDGHVLTLTSYSTIDVGNYSITNISNLGVISNVLDEDIIVFRRDDVSAGEDIFGIGFNRVFVPLTKQIIQTNQQLYLGGELFGNKRLFGSSITGYSDAGITQTIKLDGLTGRLDFGFGGGDYIISPMTGQINFYADNILMFRVVEGATDFLELGTGVNLVIGATTRLQFDGDAVGGNTYMTESSADQLRTYVGGEEAFRITETGGVIDAYFPDAIGTVGIPTAAKFYFDGQGAATDTFIYSPVDNELIIAAGASGIQIKSGGANFALFSHDIILNPGGLLRLDGSSSGDTYIGELSANLIGIRAGGVTTLEITNSLVQAYVNFAILSNNRLYFDGGTNSYFTYSSANTEVQWYIGGVQIAKIDSDSGFGILSAFSSSGVQVNLATSTGSIGKVGTLTNHDFYIMSSNVNRLLFEATGAIRVQASTNFIVEAQDPPAENGHVTSHSICKAHGYHQDNTDGTDLGASSYYNVSSITDLAANGQYIVNLNTDFTNSDYTALVTGEYNNVGGGDVTSQVYNYDPGGADDFRKTPGAFYVFMTDDSSGTGIDRSFYFACFGSI